MCWAWQWNQQTEWQLRILRVGMSWKPKSQQTDVNLPRTTFNKREKTHWIHSAACRQTPTFPALCSKLSPKCSHKWCLQTQFLRGRVWSGLRESPCRRKMQNLSPPAPNDIASILINSLITRKGPDTKERQICQCCFPFAVCRFQTWHRTWACSGTSSQRCLSTSEPSSSVCSRSTPSSTHSRSPSDSGNQSSGLVHWMKNSNRDYKKQPLFCRTHTWDAPILPCTSCQKKLTWPSAQKHIVSETACFQAGHSALTEKKIESSLWFHHKGRWKNVLVFWRHELGFRVCSVLQASPDVSDASTDRVDGDLQVISVLRRHSHIPVPAPTVEAHIPM